MPSNVLEEAKDTAGGVGERGSQTEAVGQTGEMEPRNRVCGGLLGQNLGRGAPQGHHRPLRPFQAQPQPLRMRSLERIHRGKNINFVAYKNHWSLESLHLHVVMALTIQIRIKATRIDWKGSVITRRRLTLSPVSAEYSR